MAYFTHLHVHSHYSILDGMSKVPDLIKKCKKNGMYAMALTDHGNMYGIKELVDVAAKENGKVKGEIKEHQAVVDNNGPTPELKAAAAEQIAALNAELAALEAELAAAAANTEAHKAAKAKAEEIKEQIKKQQAVLDDNGSTEEEKRAATEQIAKLQGQFFKPIIGIEAYCARRTLYDKDKNVTELNPETGKPRIVDRSGWHLILLAKNKQGYKSLCKLSSIAFTDGFYDRPRVDHNLLEQYREGVICCSACLGGEIPQKILAGDIAGAEASMLWFKKVYGDDYYIELQRHETDKPNAARDTYEKQKQVNAVLIELARKHDIKIIATNDVHFVEEEHGEAHDHLICISTQADFKDPNRMHYTKQEWLKSPDEMAKIFADLPEALENTREIADKVEVYSIDSDPIMPMFDIPESFGKEKEWRTKYTEKDLFDEFTQNEKHEVVLSQEDAEKKIKKLGGYEKLYRIKFEADYLESLVWAGAKKRYGDELTEEQRERIVFELHTIKTMGFPGYFLIVADYIRGAREELGVSVGPGRGSAAGSVVAYCLWITDVDPLKYDLLFERFLNPDRISLPDIDVDFDDAGRGRVLDWITEKYGKEKVAHIITYGTMATKSSIADVGRVEKISLSTVNQLKGYVPDKFPDGMKDLDGTVMKKAPKVNLTNCYKYVPELRALMESTKEVDQPLKNMLTYAEELEDTNRQVGVHACGVIIGADDLTNFAPISTIKDKATGNDIVVTQYDGHVVESVGLIKMDFLGLKNLTIIKDALQMIKKNHGVDLDIDHLPIDDEKTYELFGAGNTVGTFQFESAGMQKYLKELKPSAFGDIIAMNALYRPGPMDYIPDFIDRKLGRKPIVYDIPCMEEYLKDTYGITVYQEQVMLLSRQLAGFTRGQSDTLRKAMGKKQIEKMNELEVLFYKGGEANGHPKEKLKKIWEDWKKFASYAFNKSHATCYSWVAYQTAYLKAHYPAEYMAAVMTSGQDDITRTSQLIEDCKKNGIDVLLPSVNESEKNFSVNSKGQIRFGLQAISGMGEAAAEEVIKKREEGEYTDIFDFLQKVDLHSVNRKNVEVLVKAGAFDGLGEMHRAQYFVKDGPSEDSPTYLEKLMRWASKRQDSADSSQMSIFDMCEEMKEEDHPAIPKCEHWSPLAQCSHEKEVIGLYISAHPLDTFKYEMKFFCNTSVESLNDLSKIEKNEFRFGGMVVDAKTGQSQRDNSPYGFMTIEDYVGKYELKMYGAEAQRYKPFFEKGLFVCFKGQKLIKRFKDKEGKLVELPPKLQVTEMTLMNEIMTKKAKSVELVIPLDSIDERLCKELTRLAEAYPGGTPVETKVLARNTDGNEMQLIMRSNAMLVDPSRFINEASQTEGVASVRIIPK